MVELYDLYTSERGSRKEMRELQYEISAAEELIVKWGVPGIKAGVAKVLGFGHKDGTRLPMSGVMPKGAWDEFDDIFKRLGEREKLLAERK